MRVLVTDGGGYIGSVVVEELVRDGHEVVALERRQINDIRAVAATLRDRAIEAVVHTATDLRGGASVFEAGQALLDAMIACEVRRLVFTSSAAVYGEATKKPVEETDKAVPSSPHGEAMLAFERMLAKYDASDGLRSVSLRCFNAAGASDRSGDMQDPATRLIPVVLQAAAGLRDRVEIFGGDYPTSDGTCVRDYVHVVDLARAHVLALASLDRGSATYNVGAGKGHSVLQVIDAAWRVTDEGMPVKMGPRRPGDPAALVANIERIERELGWRPGQGSRDPGDDPRDPLDAIVESAWRWMQAHPHGHAGQR